MMGGDVCSDYLPLNPYVMLRIGSFNIERCVLVVSYLIIWLACWLNSFTWPTPEKAGATRSHLPNPNASSTVLLSKQGIPPLTQRAGITVLCCGIICRAGDSIEEETVFIELESKILQLIR